MSWERPISDYNGEPLHGNFYQPKNEPSCSYSSKMPTNSSSKPFRGRLSYVSRYNQSQNNQAPTDNSHRFPQPAAHSFPNTDENSNQFRRNLNFPNEFNQFEDWCHRNLVTVPYFEEQRYPDNYSVDRCQDFDHTGSDRNFYESQPFFDPQRHEFRTENGRFFHRRYDFDPFFDPRHKFDPNQEFYDDHRYRPSDNFDNFEDQRNEPRNQLPKHHLPLPDTQTSCQTFDYGHGKTVKKKILSKNEEIKSLDAQNSTKSSKRQIIPPKRCLTIPDDIHDESKANSSELPVEQLIKCCIRCKSIDHSKLSSNSLIRYEFAQLVLSRHFEKFHEIIDENLSLVGDENCFKKHEKVYNQIKVLLLFDHCYEQSIWDYDPKFAFDYLPDTKRGAVEQYVFVYGKTYEHEENKWKIYESIVEKQNQEKVKKLIGLANNNGPQDKSKVLAALRGPLDSKHRLLYEIIENDVGFPEDGITDDLCAVCDDGFTSVLASMAHYSSEKHSNSVRTHFLNGLFSHNAIKPGDETFAYVENTLRHFEKRFKTKPTHWMCELCNVALNSEEQATNHFEGSNHKRKATEGLSGAKLFQVAAVESVTPAIEEDVPWTPATKKLRMAPKVAKNSFFANKKSHNKTTGYVGHFGKRSTGGYSGYFG